MIRSHDTFPAASPALGVAGFALALLLLPLPGAPAAVAQDSAHRSRSADRHPEMHQHGPPLGAPGNAAFAAIREVVQELESRKDTDWSRVDLEALRQHLRDMQRFTLEARVVEREPVEGGLRVVVTGAREPAGESIRRALRAHAPMLEKETGWSVEVRSRGDRTTLVVTDPSGSEARKIRGLGYIGLMATGAHHQRHHWMIATGRSPHRE